METAPASSDESHSPWEVLRVALKLGCISFGGPIAHLGYFRNEYVQKRKWINDAEYADLVALCQFLPGPASSQVGIAIGTLRAGVTGGIMAWLGFTLPSAILMTLFALTLDRFDLANAGWVNGLMVVAVAIVAQAVWGMGRQFCRDNIRIAIGAFATIVAIANSAPLFQVLIIIAAGLIGHLLLVEPDARSSRHGPPIPISRRAGMASLATMVVLLIVLPILASGNEGGAIGMINSFFRVGSLVFGGGHTILPLLENDVVAGGWMSIEQFLTGYGAQQAMPGPLLTFSAYLGADRAVPPNGVLGAVIATIAIFLPSFLLIFAALPFWGDLRSNRRFRTALAGINAAVVGILLAALYDPVITSAIETAADVALALGCLALLLVWKRPSWQVVIFGALAGQFLSVAG